MTKIGTLVVLTIVVTLSALTATANALTGPNGLQPIDDPAYSQTLNDLLAGKGSFPPPPEDVAPAIQGAADDAGFTFMGLETAASTGLVLSSATAAFLGGVIIGGYANKYLRLSGTIGQFFGVGSGSGAIVSEKWSVVTVGTPSRIAGVTAGSKVWMLEFDASGCSDTNSTSFIFTGNGAWSDGTWVCGAQLLNNAATAGLAWAGPGQLATWTNVNKPTTDAMGRASNYKTLDTKVIYMTTAQMNSTLVHSGPVPYVSQTPAQFSINPGTTEPTATDAQLAAGRATLHAAGQRTVNYVNGSLDPNDYNVPTGTSDGGAKPIPTEQPLPQPNTGETYSSYRQRLRDLGYLGQVTILDDPNYIDDGTYWTTTYDTSIAPFPPGTCSAACAPATVAATGVVTRVAVGSITSLNNINVYDRTTGQWNSIPDSPPTFDPKTTAQISIYRVPTGYIAPTNPDPGGTEPSPPGGTGGVTGGTCTTPTIPSLDLTPLTGLDFGSKFPFGVFTWLTTVYGYFNVSPVTPEVNIDFSSLSTFVPGFSAHYDVKLDAFDTYMGTIRTLISFALWVGAIWYIGVTLLGFRGGGDVSAAIEDGVEF